MAEGHNVFVCEYSAPDDFICAWEGELKVGVNPDINRQAVEKLFIHKSQL